MADRYDLAWEDLKSWLDSQRDYVVIPVLMVAAQMHELEDLWIEE